LRPRARPRAGVQARPITFCGRCRITRPPPSVAADP